MITIVYIYSYRRAYGSLSDTITITPHQLSILIIRIIAVRVPSCPRLTTVIILICVTNMVTTLLECKYKYIYLDKFICFTTACVAQCRAMANASDTQAVGHGFEPRPDH